MTPWPIRRRHGRSDDRGRSHATEYCKHHGTERMSEHLLFTVEDGMKWLRSLQKTRKHDSAEEYIRKAPSQIDTCLRRQAREEFGWADIPIGW